MFNTYEDQQAVMAFIRDNFHYGEDDGHGVMVDVPYSLIENVVDLDRYPVPVSLYISFDSYEYEPLTIGNTHLQTGTLSFIVVTQRAASDVILPRLYKFTQEFCRFFYLHHRNFDGIYDGGQVTAIDFFHNLDDNMTWKISKITIQTVKEVSVWPQ